MPALWFALAIALPAAPTPSASEAADDAALTAVEHAVADCYRGNIVFVYGGLVARLAVTGSGRVASVRLVSAPSVPRYRGRCAQRVLAAVRFAPGKPRTVERVFRWGGAQVPVAPL